MKFYIEGYGCSLNKADTQAIAKTLEENFAQKSRLETLSKGDLAIVNACAVKETTEKRMLSRIQALHNLSEKQGFAVIAFGCLSKISSEKIQKISKKIKILPPALESVTEFLGMQKREFSPENYSCEKNEGIIGIIPICRGCLGNCSYCAVKNARGSLKSHSIESLKKAFEKQLEKGKKEIWLTAQDCGCYGFDLGKNLADLLRELLKVPGEYRIRIGMANVQHLKKFLPELLEQMKDYRVFKFLHLPLQAGSDRILELMNRNYTTKEWLETVQKARKEIQEITIATDIIAGFPTESSAEFEETLQTLEKAKVDVVNISRYGRRPNTKALEFKEVSSLEKKERSRKATEFYSKLAQNSGKRMVGKEEIVLADEKGKEKTIMARTGNYKPVVLEKAIIGEFYKVKISKAEKTFLKAKILQKQ